MLRRWLSGLESQGTFRQDGPAGGAGDGGTATIEGDGGDSGAGDLGDGDQGGGEDLGDGQDGDQGGEDHGGDQGADGDWQGDGAAADQPPKTGDRREGKPLPGEQTPRSQGRAAKRIQQLLEKVNALEGRLSATEETVGSRQQTTDPIDEILEKEFPKGEEGSPERKLWEDAKEIVAPILKQLRPALLPEIRTHERALAGTLQALGRMRFEMEQLMTAVLPKDPKTGKPILPPGLAKMDRIESIRKQVFDQSGGRRVISHGDAFKELEQQLQDEADEAAEREVTIRQDERGRVIRETTQRRGASSGTGPGAQAGRVPRGAQPGGGRRTFDQLENGPDIPIR